MSEKQRGLGRGLSALLGETNVLVDTRPQPKEPVNEAKSATTASKNAAIPLLPIEVLVRNPDQPRRHFNEAEIDDLSHSIREKGILQPILVRALLTESGAKTYQIIAGERRWRAAQKAGLKEVPVIIRDLNDLEVLEIAIIENVQREDLNAIEEAQAYRMLMDRFGRTQDAVAQIVSKSRSHVANMMRLLSLPEEVQAHILHGRLSAGHARAIATASDVRSLADKIISEGLSVRQAEALAREAAPVLSRSKLSPMRHTTPDNQALEKDLQNALGLKVKLDDKGGRGEVRLSYQSLEQLDELCRRLLRG